jgi:hypothetical protein
MARSFTPTTELYKASSYESPEDRIFAIAKSFLPVFHSQIRKGKSEGGKPYNPILGEQFFATWTHPEFGVTTAKCEQVSHHPPVSACFIENMQCNFEIEATQMWKVSFGLNSIAVQTYGPAFIRLPLHGEEYKMKFPDMQGKNLIFGTTISCPADELRFKCDKTQLELVIKFVSEEKIKGYLSKSNHKIYKIKGTYHDLKLHCEKTKQHRHLIKTDKMEKVPLYQVTPLEKQKDNESRRVWHDCTVNIFRNAMEKAAAAKNQVEANQRVITKERKEKNESWEPVMFVESDIVVDNVKHWRFKRNTNDGQVEQLDLE